MKYTTYLKAIALIIVSNIIGMAGAWAADMECFSRGVAYAILNDGSGNYPVEGAGEVFVSLTADAAPTWTADTYTSETAINYGNASAGTVKQDFYFWAQANEGYRFIGWNTSKTGKTAASGSETEGAPYKKTYTHWAAGTAEEPKEQVLYAIFEKIANAEDEPVDLGDGVAAVSVEGNTYVSGSTTKNISVKVFFAEGLQFDGYSQAGDGYGVNNEARPYVTCTGSEGSVSVANVTISASYVQDSYTEFQPAFGVIELPNNIAVGEYDVHLPYSLFNTQAGGVTAPYDFKVTVLADEEPLVLVATSPTDGYIWDANPESDESDGQLVMITLTYNKTIADIDITKPITLVKENGHEFPFENCSIGILNKSQGLVSYGYLPNGFYTFTLPADVFFATNGLGNAETTVSFSVTGSGANEWAIPQYTNIAVNPSNNSEVRSLTSISIDMSRYGFDDPVGILANKGKVTAMKLTEVFNGDPNDPEAVPTILSDSIPGVTATVRNGKLVVTFTTPVAEESKVLVNIPAGIVNNLAMPVASMTPQEICEEGGCTNPAISLTYMVHPQIIRLQDVTGIGTVNHWEKDEDGHDIRIDDYTSLIGAQLTPPVNNGDEGDRVTYLYFWYPEEFSTLSYNGGASITNITTGAPYEIASIEFKTGGDAYRKNVIQMRLSTTNFIHSDVYDQGVYEVVLPDSIAFTFDGMTNEGITFQFTYGDPDKAYHPEDVDLDAYIGDYRNLIDEEESQYQTESFHFDKIDGRYCVTNLCGSPLVIPVEAQGADFVLKFTENEAGDAFMGNAGNDVIIGFVKNTGKPYIYIDQYALYSASGNMIVGGITYYEQYDPQAISTIRTDRNEGYAIYNLNGQLTANASGLVIINGRKVFIKK